MFNCLVYLIDLIYCFKLSSRCKDPSTDLNFTGYHTNTELSFFSQKHVLKTIFLQHIRLINLLYYISLRYYNSENRINFTN